MKTIPLALLGCWCSVAAAQPVFFDDFDGPDFLPHWRVPPPENWEYNISGGRLNVTDLHFPGIAHLESNFARIQTSFEAQSDFRIDVWMGWEREPFAPYDELFARVTGPSGGIMAEFGLVYPGGPAEVAAATGAGKVSIPPPPPGIYQFTIARTDSQFDFYLDGDHFGSLLDPYGLPAAGLTIWFSKEFPGEMNPKHVDRVRVIPAPGVLAPLIAWAPAWARRRR